MRSYSYIQLIRLAGSFERAIEGILPTPKLTVFLAAFFISLNTFGQLAATFTNKKDACDGLNNGSVDVTVTGSTGSITVNFFGPPNKTVFPTDGVPEPVTGLAPRTSPSEYLIVVQDDNGSVVYNLEIFNITPDLSASLNTLTDNTDCSSPNGSIDIDVSGGTGSYAYSWTGPGGFTATTQDISGLLGGNYSVDVFDNGTNCFRSLGPFTVTDPAVAIQNITTSSPLALCPGTDAVIDLDGSENGKKYEIMVNGSASGAIATGDGSPISITLTSGNFADADVLTVEGFDGLCPARYPMNGSVTISMSTESVAPTSATADNTNYCDDAVPANITLSYSGGSLGTGATAEWYNDAGFTNNVGNGNNLIITPAPSVSMTYYVRFEGSCNTTTGQSVSITVDNASVAPTSATADNTNYCDNAAPANITLSYSGGSLGMGATAEWYSDAGFTTNVGNGNNLTITPAPSVSTTYYVRFEGTCGITTAQSVSVTVDNASVAPTSATADNTNYCDDAVPANITLSYSGGSLGTGATAEWYSDAGFTTNVASGNNQPIAAPNATTTYYVRFESGCGNTADLSVTITVDNASLAPTSASVDSPAYCDNAAPANITLTYAGGSLGTGATAQWYDDAGFTNNLGNGNNLTITPAPSVSTTYFVRFEGTCGTTSAQSVLVDVASSPDATITGALSSCANTVETYSVAAGAASYVWSLSGGHGSITSGAGTNAIQITWGAVDGDDQLKVDIIGNAPASCPATNTITLSVFSTLPALTNQSTDVCQNSASFPILMATPVAGATVNWYIGSSATGTLVATGDTFTPTAAELDLTTPATTTFTYLQDIGCLVSPDATYDVVVVPQPDAGTDNSITACSADAPIDLFTQLGGTPVAGGSWTDDDNSGALTGSTFDPSTSPTGIFNFTYQVDGVGACSGQIATAVVTVTVDVSSVAPTSATVDKPNYCDDAVPTTITLSYAGGTLGTGATAEWYDDAAITNNIGSGNDMQITAPVATSTYYVRFEGTCNTTTEQSVTVTVDNISVAPTSAVVDISTYCIDAIPPTITLSYVGGTLGTNASAEWYDDAAFTNNIGSGNDLGIAGTGVTSTYYVRFEGSCGNTSEQSVTVTVNSTSLPPIPDQTNYLGCTYANPPTLNTPGTGIVWYADIALTTVVATGNSYTPVAGTDIDMQVIGTTSFYVTQNEGCGESSAVQVDVTLEGVTADLGLVRDTYPEQDIGAIEVKNIFSTDPPYEVSLEDPSGVVYDWKTLEPDLLGEYKYTFTLLSAEDYTVLVRDAKGCILPIDQTIGLRTDVFIPNVFTPNDDGYNEFFKVLNIKPNTQIIITNRWGVKVFESDDYQNDWRADNLPEGVYFYTIKMAGQVYHGNVEVWRNKGPGSN